MKEKPQKLILVQRQSPGDILMMAYALKALHEQHPGKYITDAHSPCPEIFEGNPYVTPLSIHDPEAKVMEMHYPWIHKSNQAAVHFVNSIIHDLGNQLNIKLEPIDWSGAIYIREEEKYWFSAPREILGADVPYWVIGAGYKTDYTLKAWSFARWQQVIDACPNVFFVQIGVGNHPHHVQPQLKGHNLINMIDKTDIRQLIRLIYNAFGVLCYVSFPMVLSYAIPPHPRFNRKSRACITLAGAREPNMWQAIPNGQFLHKCGMLDCCDLGGCWKSRIVPLGDGDGKDKELCLKPIQMPDGQWIPKCMDMISAEEVIKLINEYMDNLDYKSA